MNINLPSFLNAEKEWESILIFLVVCVLTVIAGKAIDRFLFNLLKRSDELFNADPTNSRFFRRVVTAVVYILGFSIAIYTVPALRTLSTSLLAGAGLLAVAVGFASQKAFSNIISGLFLVAFKPFRVNQMIAIGNDVTGRVVDITLRHTVVKNLENKRIVIPNSLISEQIVTNIDAVDQRICRGFEVLVAYDTDLNRVFELIAQTAQKHPLNIDVRTEEDLAKGLPRIGVRVIELAPSGIKIKAWLWANTNGEAFEMACDLNKEIVELFRQENIVIPFPQQTLWINQEEK